MFLYAKPSSSTLLDSVVVFSLFSVCVVIWSSVIRCFECAMCMIWHPKFSQKSTVLSLLFLIIVGCDGVCAPSFLVINKE